MTHYKDLIIIGIMLLVSNAGCVLLLGTPSPTITGISQTTPVPTQTSSPQPVIKPTHISSSPTPFIENTPIPTASRRQISQIENNLQRIYARPRGFDSVTQIPAFVTTSYENAAVFFELLEVLEEVLATYPCEDLNTCLTSAYQNLPAGPTARQNLPEQGEPDSDLVMFEPMETESHAEGHYYYPQWMLNTSAGTIIHVMGDDNIGYNFPDQQGPDHYQPRIRHFLAEPLAKMLAAGTAFMEAEGNFIYGERLVVNTIYRSQADSDWLSYYHYGTDARPGGESQHNEGFAVDLRILSPQRRLFRGLTTAEVEKLSGLINDQGFFWAEGLYDDRPHVTYMGILDEKGQLLVSGQYIMDLLQAASFDLYAIQTNDQARTFYELYRLAVSYNFYLQSQSIINNQP